MTEDYDPFEAPEGSTVPEGLPCVELEFATLRRFREEMAPYLNYDGFFARTDRPVPRGASVEFKFVMPEDFVLAHGTAVVAWTIEPEGNPDLVPGMALRFAEVGKQSRAVIDELVDFHIATGGDPFDLGPRGSRPGEILTDSLGGIGGAAPSRIDSVAPTPRDLPLPPDPEESTTPPSAGGVLPDWLSDASLPQTALNSLEAGGRVEGRSDATRSTGRFGDSSSLTADTFEVDMIFDSGEKDSTPNRLEDGSFQQMAMAPKAADKPPRDFRPGLVVAVGLGVVAIVVLVWSFWMKSDEEDTIPPSAEVVDVSPAGVTLIDDEAEVESAEVVPDAADSAAAPGEETAAKLAAEPEPGASPEPAARASAPEAPEDAGSTDEAAVPTKNFVAENSPDTMPAARAGARASRVVDVVAAAQGGVTSVVIRGNGVFDDSSFRVVRLENPLRIWVGVMNIETSYRPNEIDVASPEVDRVRIGYHPEDNPPALYVVLDLTSDDMVLLEKSVAGDAIRLTVGRK